VNKSPKSAEREFEEVGKVSSKESSRKRATFDVQIKRLVHIVVFCCSCRLRTLVIHFIEYGDWLRKGKVLALQLRPI